MKGLSHGQKLNMLHKSGTTIFLFKEEDVETELISIRLLILGTLTCLAYFLKSALKKVKTQGIGLKNWG